MNPIDTSIVLATCTRASMLRGALASLIAQACDDAHPLEIIVVDDGSTDETPTLLAELQRSSPIPITILQGSSQGVAAARNLGSRAARGAWIASFDDDQLALPNWLRELRALADTTEAACVGGSLTLDYPAGFSSADFGPRARAVLGEHVHGDAPFRYTGKPHPSTNNVLIRREVFDALHGYDTTFTEGGEDKDFFERVAAAGYEQWYQPASKALHLMTPRRLDRANLRWTSIRLGASDVRVHQRKLPYLAPIKLAAVRVAVTLLRDLPQLAVAKLRHDRRAQLDVECSLWYTQGLLRALIPILTARTDQSRFMRSIDFRTRNGERTTSTQRPGL
jgi:GT2 family glycosyltransferase